MADATARFRLLGEDATAAAFNSALGNAKRTALSISNVFKSALSVVGAGLIIKEIVEKTSEQEKQTALLTNAVKQNSGAVGFNVAQLQDQASALQKVTVFGDEQVESLQQLLLRYKSIQGINFQRATKAALDMATVLGTDLPAAAKLVGVALENPQRGMTQLARYGLIFTEAQQKVIKSLIDTGDNAKAQDYILKRLESTYGGAASAARNTFGGALTGLKNAFGDLLEANTGVPAATKAINEFSSFLADPSTKKAADELLSGLIASLKIVAELAAKVGPALNWLVNGPSPQQKLQEQLKFLQGERNSSIPVVLNFGYLDNGKLVMGPAALDAEIKRIQGQLDALNNPVTHAEGTRGKGHHFAAPVSTDTSSSAEAYTEMLKQANDDLNAFQNDFMKSSNDRKGEVKDEISITLEANQERQKMFDDWMAREDELANHTHETFVDMSEYAKQAARNMQDSLAKFLFDPFKDGLKGMLKGFIDTIREIVAQAAAAKIFGSKASGGFGLGDLVDAGVGGFLGSVFGGGKAAGGPLEQGKWYVAGEKGPEPIWGGGPGAFAAGYGGSGSVTIINKIDARGATSDLIRALPAILEASNRKAVDLARSAVRNDLSRGAYR